MFEVRRPVLGIRKRESVAADINLTILTCMCVVAQNDQRAVTGIGCCTDEHADMLRGFLTPGPSAPVTGAASCSTSERTSHGEAEENTDSGQ